MNTRLPATELLSYISEYYEYIEDELGFVFKKANARRNTHRIGQRIGNRHPDYGYVSVKIKGRYYREHHLVFLLFNKRLPEDEIDHINKVQWDNRIENLRECARGQNCAHRSNTWNTQSGYRGVHLHKKTGKWEAGIRVNKKRIYLGLYEDKVEAAKAYDEEAKKHFGDFATLNFK